MTARLERILYKLAQQHAPHLTPPGWDQEGDSIGRLQTLARRLASYNIAVLVCEVPQELLKIQELHVDDWIRSYARFYQLLANTLFPSFAKLSAYYADNRYPPVVILHGEATPVIGVISGYVTPYVTVRQGHRVSDLELNGFMDFILGELEAGDLPRGAYEGLRETGVQLLRHILAATVHHVSLTTFDSPILDDIQPARPPESSPETSEAAPAPPPGDLPEQEQIKLELERLPEDDSPTTPTEEMFVNRISLTKPSRRPPPVPGLPRDEESDD